MLEIGGDRISFLDTTIIKNNNKLIFDSYHKPIYSGRYLSFFSRHPLCQKKGTIIELVDKMFMLSHPSFHQKFGTNYQNFIDENLIEENDYPLNFMFKTISNRIRHLITNSNNKT